jgi:MoaA/NifB/PqqE/SkfB family radical SAM enzyme
VNDSASVARQSFGDYLLNHACRTLIGRPAACAKNAAAYSRLLMEIVHSKARREKVCAERGIAVPVLMFLAATGQCNLSCGHCYTRGYPKAHMSLELARRIVSEARELGVSLFVITGGEPLLYPEFLQIPRSMPEVPFVIFTNGSLVPEFLSSEEATPNMLWAVSIDGPRDANDARRGEGTFDLACRAMEALRSKGLPFGFSATLSEENLVPAMSAGFVHSMVERGCWNGFFLEQIPGPVCDPPLGTRIAKRLRKCRQGSPIPLAGFPADEVEYEGCQAAGRGLIHISPEGYVEPCPAAHLAIESLQDVSLEAALNGPFFKELRKVSRDLPPEGGSCTYDAKSDEVCQVLASYPVKLTR